MLVKFRPDTVAIKEKTEAGVFSLDKAEIKSSSIKSLNAKYNISKIKSFVKKERKLKKIRSGNVVELPDLSQIYLLEFPKDIDVMSAVEEYKKDPSVEFAEPNYIRKVFTPDDPCYLVGPSPDNSPNQWGLYKIWLVSLEAGNSGWNIITGESTVKVAVIDTGANYNHVDLKNRVDSLEGYDFADGDSDPLDDHGHGSHVSGIIGADTNNGTGIAGVDWSCRIIPIKVFDSLGRGSDGDIINGIIWAVSKEADVINMSFGPSDPGDSGYSSSVALAISYAATSDCVLVAAAGNDNISSPQKYPAAYDHVIAVAATDPDDRKASYSNYGSWIDASAPGGDNGPGAHPEYHYILSAWYTGNDYYWAAGTSMAAPFVSGLAALVRAKYPAMSADEVSQKIIDYSDNIDAYNPAYVGKLGKGRINAFAALGGFYAYISHPARGGTEYGRVEIKGNATGEGFTHYTVEYGMGRSPSSWITLTTSTETKLNAVLATLDATGMDSYVTVKLTVNDIATTEVTFHAGSLDSAVIPGRAQYGPNPFNPKKESIMIMYDLTANSDTYIYFFDIAGNSICRKFYAYGTSGGNSGTNRVYWDGKNDFGETVANGVYLFRIASEGRTIGKGKIIVLK